MKKLLSAILAMIMLVGTFSVSAVSKTPKEWELIYDYYYSYGKNDFYSIKIYRNETVSGASKKTFSTKYKFIVYNNKDLVEGVEYITPEAYKWSPSFVRNNKIGYSKSLNVDCDKYLNKKEYPDYHNYITGEILQIAVTQDKYLHMSYMNKIQNIIKGKDKTLTHLCYKCFEACKTKKVCRYCNGDLIDTGLGKAVCQECKKSQYLSLAKDVCSVCKNEYLTSIKSLWCNVAIYPLRDVQENFPNLANYDSNTYDDDKIFTLLKYNWENSEDEIIKKGRKIQQDWKTASHLYDNSKGIGLTEENKDLFYAVYLNRYNSYMEFSNNKTTYLINKYIQMARSYYDDKIQESIIGIFGELCPNLPDVLEKVISAFINLNDDDQNKEYEIEDKYGEEYKNTAEEEIAGKKFLNNLAEEYGNEFKGKFIQELENAISDVTEVAKLCFDVQNDLSDYYDSSFEILMGKSIVRQGEIGSLCDKIALAAMSQHIQENYVDKEYKLN